MPRAVARKSHGRRATRAVGTHELHKPRTVTPRSATMPSTGHRRADAKREKGTRATASVSVAVSVSLIRGAPRQCANALCDPAQAPRRVF